MNKKSRFSLLIFLVSLLIITGFGCKGLSQAEQTATKPVTLEYWTVYDDVDTLRSLIDAYRAAGHPQIAVNVRQYQPSEIYGRLIEALSEDKGPDIISVYNRSIPVYLSKLSAMPASVKDTTILIQKNQVGGQDTTVSTKDVALITPNQVESEYVQAVKGDAVLDGKIYGLPLSLDTMALYYNKDLLDRVGVAEPPKNWDEFQTAVKKITRYDQKGQIVQEGAALGTGNNVVGVDDLLFMLFRQSNLKFTTKSGQALFNSGSSQGGETPAMKVMDFYTDFANSNRDTYTWNESFDNALDSFINGSLGFFFGYSYNYAQIAARAPQLNFGAVPMLQLNPSKPINVASYWLQCVPEKSKHQDEAWALINYFAHSKATKDYLDKTDRPTALRTYISAQNQKPELAPFVSQVLIAEDWYKGKNYDAAAKALGEMVHAWLQAVPNPDQILQYRQTILNQAADKVNQTL